MVQNPVEDDLASFIAPVNGIHAPLNGKIPVPGYCIDGFPAVIPIREPEQAHILPGQLQGFLVRSLNLIIHLLSGQCGKRRVAYTVIADFMPPSYNLLCGFRILIHPVACEKKVEEI